jgi:hypothetical protein
MIRFQNEIVVTKHYRCSVDEFMDLHFREAQKYESELDVYIASVNSGLLCRAFSVALLPEEVGLDFCNHANIKAVLARKFAD